MVAGGMLKPDEVRSRAQRRFARRYRSWAAELFAQEATDAHREDTEELSISLHPPTEQRALDDLSAARSWVTLWRSCELSGSVRWEPRRWASVGAQELPCRVVLHGAAEIAQAAEREGDWKLLSARVRDLARAWRESWSANCPCTKTDSVTAAVASTAQRLLEVSDVDWRICLGVIGWFVEHPNEACFVRQLPIHGIDTKWMERHRSLVEPLVEAMTGEVSKLVTPPKLVRIHLLDEAEALRGISQLAVPLEALDRLDGLFRAVLVCENLVNALALPAMPGVLAIHGGGYAVGELGRVGWLADVPLLYWGDLDSNGFAILNRLRSHLPETRSVLMDGETLARHADLCVEESEPCRADLSQLTEEEQDVLAALLAGDERRGIEALRLEQERIEWQWACERIKEELSALYSQQA